MPTLRDRWRAFVDEVRTPMSDWGRAGLDLGDGWRESVLGAARLGAELLRTTGAMLRSLADELAQWREEQPDLRRRPLE